MPAASDSERMQDVPALTSSVTIDPDMKLVVGAEVCVRERERERLRQRDRDVPALSSSVTINSDMRFVVSAGVCVRESARERKREKVSVREREMSQDSSVPS